MYKKIVMIVTSLFILHGMLNALENGSKTLLQQGGGAIIKIKSGAELDKYIGTGKIVVLYFSSVTCGPCKAFHPILEQLAQENPGVLFIEVCAGVVHDCQNLVNRYAVRGYPGFVFHDAQGNKIDSFSGNNENTKGKIEAVIAKIKTGMAKPMGASSPVQPIAQSQPIASNQPMTPTPAGPECKKEVKISYPQKDAEAAKAAAMQEQRQTKMKVKKGRRPRQQ